MARYQLVIVQRTELGETEAASCEAALVTALARWHGMSEADKSRAGSITTPRAYYVMGIEPLTEARRYLGVEASQGEVTRQNEARQGEASRNDSDGETQSATQGDNDA